MILITVTIYRATKSYDSTIAEVTIIAICTNTVTRSSAVAVIADHTAYRTYSIAAELNCLSVCSVGLYKISRRFSSAAVPYVL